MSNKNKTVLKEPFVYDGGKKLITWLTAFAWFFICYLDNPL